MLEYHDREWGVPVHDDRLLFEFLILEGAQAGLSWMTILRKRDAYRKAFRDFDPAAVARFREATIDRLITDPTIVRNRAKIESAVRNAHVVQAISQEQGSFDQRITRLEQGSDQAWGELRRTDDLLRLHAGHRARQRPPGQLLPLSAGLAAPPP